MKEKSVLGERMTREVVFELQKSQRECKEVEVLMRVLQDRLGGAIERFDIEGCSVITNEQNQVMISNLNAEVEKLKGEKLAAHRTIEELRHQNSEASITIRDLRDKQSTADETIKELRSENDMKVAELVTEVERLKGEKLAVGEAVCEMKHKLFKADQTVEWLKRQNSEASDVIEELKTRILGLEETIKRMEYRRLKDYRTTQELRDKYSEASVIIEELKSKQLSGDPIIEELKRVKFEASIEELKQRLLRADETIAEMRRKEAEAEKTIEDLRSQGLEAWETVDELRRQNLKAELKKRRFEKVEGRLANILKFKVDDANFRCSEGGKRNVENVDSLKRGSENLPSLPLAREEGANNKNTETTSQPDNHNIEGEKKRKIVAVSDSEDDELSSDDVSCSSSFMNEFIGSVQS